ncbi:MAG: hypothetical protein QXP53_00800 [Candidatus Pacearchaeota archaeon]
MKPEYKEIEVECPKCKAKAKVKANNQYDTFYSCSNCGELIVVKKLGENF